MIRRRDFFRLGLAAGAAGLFSADLEAQQDDLKKFLCLPDGLPPDLLVHPSPKSTPFVAEMNIPPLKRPTPPHLGHVTNFKVLNDHEFVSASCLFCAIRD